LLHDPTGIGGSGKEKVIACYHWIGRYAVLHDRLIPQFERSIDLGLRS
jgi:hypothetical protein